MKLQILSDLHLERFHGEIFHHGYTPIDSTVDVIVLAGDIANGDDSLIYAHNLSQKHGKHVIWTPGNHEFYYKDFWHMMFRYQKTFKNKNTGVSILLGFNFPDSIPEDFSTIIENVKFTGGTLWTDFELYSGSVRMNSSDMAMDYAKKGINDFRLIRNKKQLFTPQDSLYIHKQTKHIINSQLDIPFVGKKVVISHHGPTSESIHPSYRVDSRILNSNHKLPHESDFWKLNPCFASDIKDIVTKSDLWIHGHTHKSLDYYIQKCRVVANPRGYPINKYSSNISWENPDYQKFCIIEI